MYGLSDQAKGMLRTRFSAVRQGSIRYLVAMIEGTLAQMFFLRGRWRSAGPLCPAGCSAGENEDEPIGCRLRAPHLARPAMELAHLGTSARDRDDGELLCRWIESDDRIGAEVGQPDDAKVVREHRIGHGIRAGEPPLTPRAGGRVEDAELSGIPFADPDSALSVGPDATRALTRGRRLLDG